MNSRAIHELSDEACRIPPEPQGRRRGTGPGIVGGATVVAALALADSTATVRAHTQRQSDANLTLRQYGWYNNGDRITLVCSRRERAVEGHFSFNIPNGGLVNLSYKTSDGDFVADVDIETGPSAS